MMMRYLHKSAFKCNWDAFGWLKTLETNCLGGARSWSHHKPGCSTAAALQHAPICNWITHTCSIYCILIVINVSTSKTAHESSIRSQRTSAFSSYLHRATIINESWIFYLQGDVCCLDCKNKEREKKRKRKEKNRQRNITVTNSRADTWKFLTGIFVTHVLSRCPSWRRCRRKRVELLRVRVLSWYG